jgi:L-seryl-tRNA(Ser) seleniumtransferase
MNNHQLNRRSFVTAGAAAVGTAGLAGGPADGKDRTKSYGVVYRRLSIPTVINAMGFYTSIGGSLMPPEVREAMEDAAQHFVNLELFQQRAGQRIAELTGAEFALVTSGTSAAITLGTAGVMTGHDRDKVRRLPDTSGMKNEVIIQRRHRNTFDAAVRAAGARIVEAETPEEYESAFNQKTAMVYHLVADRHWPPRIPAKIKLEQALAIAREHGVPYLVDAAAEVPPPGNLSYFIRKGVDLVCFSGGKGLMGPQCSGLLLGKRELVQAAWMNHMASSDTIGRSMKVGKEEIAGLLAAVERMLTLNYSAVEREWKARLDRIADHVKGLSFVEARPLTEDIEPPHVPRLTVRWNEEALKLTKDQVINALREATPSIYVNNGAFGLTIVPALLQAGDEEIVGQRLREVLAGSVGRAAGA